MKLQTLILSSVLGLMAGTALAGAPVDVYKSPYCGCCGKWVEHLRRNGFEVVRVMDAQSHDHLSTKIFYFGNMEEVRRILSVLPEVLTDAELFQDERMGTHIRIIIGKDLIEKNRNLTWNKSLSVTSKKNG